LFDLVHAQTLASSPGSDRAKRLLERVSPERLMRLDHGSMFRSPRFQTSTDSLRRKQLAEEQKQRRQQRAVHEGTNRS
jgi:hypothetical protein